MGVFKAIMQDSNDKTTESAPSPLASLTTGRRRRLRKPGSLFSTEERRKSPIFNRQRNRVKLLRDREEKSTTTTAKSTTTEAEDDDEDISNVVDTL